MQLLSAGLPHLTEHAAAAQIMAGAHHPEEAPVIALTMGDTPQHASTAFSLACSVCCWALSAWITLGTVSGDTLQVTLPGPLPPRQIVFFELLTLNCCYLLSDSFSANLNAFEQQLFGRLFC